MRNTGLFRLLPLLQLGGILPAVIAVVLWSLAPVLANLAQQMPPLQLTAQVLLFATLATWPIGRLNSGRHAARVAVPVCLWVAAPLLMIGAIGFYFMALRLAPPAKAALVSYTWPVLFVIAAELAQARRVRPPSIGGAALAFGAAALLLMPEGGVAAGIPWAGYACAFASGTCWATFSLLARRQPVPLTSIMPWIMGTGAAIAGIGHALFETTLSPVPDNLGLSIVLIGIGPYGLAFLAWDSALRRGNSATVGTLAYAVPVLSALLLVATGMAAADWRLPVAAFGVVAGSAIAGRPSRPAPARAGAIENTNPVHANARFAADDGNAGHPHRGIDAWREAAPAHSSSNRQIA